MKSRKIVPFMLAVAMITIVLLATAYFFATGINPVAAVAPSPAYREYANGVYYFPSTGDEYISALEEFYANNPSLHCDYQGVTDSNLGATGLILHCHDIAISAQDVTVP